MDELGSFPYEYDAEQKTADTTWDGPTLVYKGTQSAYINHKNLPAFGAFFPNMRLEELDTGHWGEFYPFFPFFIKWNVC